MRPSLPEVPELLARLVQCPSVGGPDGNGEAAMASLLAHLLEPWADEVTVTEVVPGRPCLIAKFEGLDPTRAFAFEAHSDTVSVEGMSVDPFAATVRDGRLYGRGACDTKGPMAAMLLAILRHLRDHGRPPVTWYFLSTCDEELGGLGARHLVESGFRCDGIVVGEPTSLRAVDAHKGAVRYTVTISGKAAHSSTPELGANAVHAAAQFILHLERGVSALDRPEFASEPGPPTLNVGTIRGGDQVNRIPAQAALEIDIRLPYGWEEGLADGLLTEAASVVQASRPGIRVTHARSQYYPPFALPMGDAFRSIVSPLATAGYANARYATNAGFFAAAGIPCVVFGPGASAQAHTADEWVALAEVEEAARLLGRCIAQAKISSAADSGIRSQGAGIQPGGAGPGQSLTGRFVLSETKQASRTFCTSAPRAKSASPGVPERMAVMKRW